MLTCNSSKMDLFLRLFGVPGPRHVWQPIDPLTQEVEGVDPHPPQHTSQGGGFSGGSDTPGFRDQLPCGWSNSAGVEHFFCARFGGKCEERSTETSCPSISATEVFLRHRMGN